MVRRPRVVERELHDIADFLRDPQVTTELHAEVPDDLRDHFEGEYFASTSGEQPPENSYTNPYWVWPRDTNKHGVEGRIYFAPFFMPVPEVVENLVTDQGAWFMRANSYRINHTNLFMQLLECGFLLGRNEENLERIHRQMAQRFPHGRP